MFHFFSLLLCTLCLQEWLNPTKHAKKDITAVAMQNPALQIKARMLTYAHKVTTAPTVQANRIIVQREL